MSPAERAVSICLALHIVLITTTAVALSPDSARSREEAATPRQNAVSRSLTPVFAGLGSAVATANASLRSGMPTLIRVAGTYTRRLGLGQLWTMFSEPIHTQRYVKVAFQVADPDSKRPAQAPVQLLEELVYPAARTDAVRGILTEDFHRTKAVDTTLMDFRARGRRPEDLALLANYLRADFCRRTGTPPARVVRTEIWVGTVPIDRSGESIQDASPPERNAAIADYFDGPRLTYRTPQVSPGSAYREADIIWSLYYADPAEGPSVQP